MQLETLPQALSVCKLAHMRDFDPDTPFFFLGRTDEEISLVCETKDVPPAAAVREDGWRGLRITGTLDFSLIGILSRLSGVLADNGIGLFAVSTYNTDYILVKAENFTRACAALADAGYSIA